MRHNSIISHDDHLMQGHWVLLGPLATYALTEPATYAGLFDAIHTHTITSGDLLLGSKDPAPYAQLRADRDSYEGLIAQLRWCPIAEVELYRGCTRRQFCSFCNEPVKARSRRRWSISGPSTMSWTRSRG